MRSPWTTRENLSFKWEKKKKKKEQSTYIQVVVSLLLQQENIRMSHLSCRFVYTDPLTSRKF